MMMPDSSEDEDEDEAEAEVVSSSRSAARAKDPRLTRSSPQTLKGAIAGCFVCLFE
jgi:hypothetical protein